MGAQDQEQAFSVGLADAWTIVRMQRTTVALVAGIVVTLTLFGSLLMTPLYESTVVLHLRPLAGQEMKSERVDDQSANGARANEIRMQTQLEILRSRSVLQEVLTRFEALGLDSKKRTPKTLRRHMKATLRENSELVDIRVTDPDPNAAAALANLIAEVHRESTLEASRDAARDARVWLQKQVGEYETRIDELSSEIAQYQADNDLADAELDVTARSAEMEALNLAYGQVNTQKVTLSSAIEVHESLARRGKYQELSKAMGTPLVQALTGDYATAVTKHAKIAARYGKKHPERQYAEAELARIESEIQGEVSRTIASEKASLSVLQSNMTRFGSEIAQAKVQLLEKQRLLDGYLRLRRELERSTSQYTLLNQRRDELDLQARTQLSNVRIIDRALPSSAPSSPRIFLNLILGLIMGLGLGVGVGFVREYLDDTITSRADVETFLGLSFLGQIPRIDVPEDERALYSHHHPSSAVAESVRAIRTLLDLSPAGQLRLALVTSALMSEGKTETTVRLAVAFARLGRRVLVIDADLRRPRIHKVFGLERSPGLNEVLHGVALVAAVRATAVPNVDILAVGDHSVRATDLLASVEMEELLEVACERYDLVLIDTPPAGLAADAAMLARLVDGVLFVTREATGSRRGVLHTIRDLERAGADIRGAILNAVGARSSPYSYGYGYTYSSDDPVESEDSAAK